MLEYFLNLVNLLGGVVYRLLNRLGCHMPCESLDGFWETWTHSKARDGCYVLTFSGQDVTKTSKTKVSYLNENLIKSLVRVAMWSLFYYFKIENKQNS